jgi:hypothetical protein
MASSEMAELVVRIRADATRLESEMKRVSGVVQQSGSKMQTSLGGVAAAARTLMPALSVAAIVSFSKSALQAAGAITDMAQQIGFSTNALLALEVPLAQTGSSIENFSSAINLMNANIGQAAQDMEGSLAQAFQRLGIDIQALLAMSPEQQFYTIADALSQVGTQFEQTEIGRAVFGRGFAKLIPLIQQANGDMRQFADAASETDKALADSVKVLDDFGDKLSAVAIEARNEFIKLLAVIVNVLNAIGDVLPEGNKSVRGAYSLAKVGVLPDSAESRQAAWEAKSRAGGFVTTASEMYGPAMPVGGAANTNIPRVRQAAAAAIKQTQEKTEADNKQADALDRARRESEAFTESLKNNLAQGLTQAAFTAGSAGNAFRNMALQIAQAIFERSVSQPLSNGIVNGIDGLLGGSGGIGGFFKDILPSFDVGSYNLPKDMIAQVHKGEMIIPAAQAQQIRSGGGMGGGVTVVQNNTFGNGVNRAELQAMLPQVAKAAHDAVFSSMQRGGSASKIAGVR